MSVARHAFEALGTSWTIETRAALPSSLLSRMHTRVDDFDRAYSRFRPDSLVSRFAETGGTCELPDDAGPLLAFYRVLYEATDGRVSPLVGRALEHLGYDPQYSLQRRPGVATVPDWDDVLRVQGSVLVTSEPILLDFGAAGKGYLVDLLAEELNGAGIAEYVVDASGDLVRRGPDECRVGLEDPVDPTRVIGVANLRSGAICGSADNRRSWGGLHHIIDAATAEPTTAVTATWVVAASAMVADGLATALFMAEPATLARAFAFSYVRMPTAGGVEYSTNFDGELFT